MVVGKGWGVRREGRLAKSAGSCSGSAAAAAAAAAACGWPAPAVQSPRCCCPGCLCRSYGSGVGWGCRIPPLAQLWIQAGSPMGLLLVFPLKEVVACAEEARMVFEEGRAVGVRKFGAADEGEQKVCGR
eukprot:215721-Pelagomonas_calceolata.AAC.2